MNENSTWLGKLCWELMKSYEKEVGHADENARLPILSSNLNILHPPERVTA